MRFVKGCRRYRRKTSWTLYTIEYIFIMVQIVLTGKITGFTFQHMGVTQETTPIPSIIDGRGNVTTYVGGFAQLNCTVLNLGTKTVVWKKTDKKDPLTIGALVFTPDDRFQVVHIPHLDQWNLVIKDAKHKDSGVYECQISSTLRSIRQQVRLKVIGYDDPASFGHTYQFADPSSSSSSSNSWLSIDKGIQISDTAYVNKGDTIILSCNATAQDVNWFKQGIKVATDETRRITIRKKIHYQQRIITSFLEIQTATMDDDSDYICRASNDKTNSVKVHVLNDPGTDKDKRGSAQPEDKAPYIDGSSSVSRVEVSSSLTILATFIFLRLTVKYLLGR